MGARFPGAPDLAHFRDLVRAGRVVVGPVPAERWDHRVVHSFDHRERNKTPANAGGFMANIDRFAPEFFGITPRRARIMDPQQRLALEITRQALEDAGYSDRRLAGGRVGVYFGASSSDHRLLAANPVNLPCDLAGRSGVAPEITAEVAAAVSAALPPIQAYTIVGQQLNMIAANISQAFDFKGPAFAIDTACSSALAALHEAVLHLRAGVIDAAVVGGVYVQLDPVMMVCFSRIGALSFTDECRPFETAANGFVLSEGVGAIVLKRLDDAQRDGDRISAVVRGVAMNNDGRAAGPLTPDPGGQSSVIRGAWADAGLAPDTVGLLEAHATATPAGDGVELAALQDVFRGAAGGDRVPISSVKANLGHGLSSAGIASFIKAALAVRDGFVPPQPMRGALREELTAQDACLRVPSRVEPWPEKRARRAGVSAFGFGGTNVHVVLEAAPVGSVRARSIAAHLPSRETAAAYRFEFSAPTPGLLAAYAERLADFVRESDVALADLSFTLAHRRKDAVAASFIARDRDAFLTQATALARGGMPGSGDGGVVGEGQTVTLPPSPLAERRFWLLDESRRRKSEPGTAPALTEATMIVNGRGHDLVVNAIAAVTSWRAEDIKPTQRLAGDLGFDSLTTLEFMTVLGRNLPGLPPPPRTLFTSSLTVAELVRHLDHLAATTKVNAPRVPAITYEPSRDPWLQAHRPAGRALLPMAALVHAAIAALRDQSATVAITGFKVLTPVEVTAGSMPIGAELGADLRFTLYAGAAGAAVATGRASRSPDPLPELEVTPGRQDGLSLPAFYSEFGFHGPELQALRERPWVSVASAHGELPAGLDPVVTLDGALQLALYWLAASRKVTAVATGFAEYRQLAPWPRERALRCVARLAGEGGRTLTGDFDFIDPTDRVVAQWRGVEAEVLDGGQRRVGASGPETWDEVRTLAARKSALAAAGLTMPYFHSHDGVAAATTRIAGREFINFSSYNYLGLAGHPAVRRAAAAALERFGTSASASRVASGERPVHRDLEQALAAFLGCPDALALVSGHATNVSVIGHLFGPEDLVIHDQLAHDCIVTGARLSGARRLSFPHNDVAALADLLARERPNARRALIAVEGVYSMDGDIAPLPEIVALKRTYDAVLLLDEAHSFGVLGATGRGAGEHFGVARSDVDLWMGTLSKSLASCGGYLAGSAELIDYLRFTLPGFVYSVGLSPANAAAGRAALEILAQHPELPRQLQARSEFFRGLCRERAIDIGMSAGSAVVPCLTGASDRALRLADALSRRGINVQPIFHPAVEEGRARLRFFLTAEHTEQQLAITSDAVADEIARLDGKHPVRA